MLLHLLAARHEGPPHLRLTAVHEHWDVLTQTAMDLTKEAEAPFIPLKHASASLGVPNEAEVR